MTSKNPLRINAGETGQAEDTIVADKMIASARKLLGGVVVAAMTLTAVAGAAVAETKQIRGAAYVPTIWVDPDGCEHWVMDDGAEGYMTPNVSRQGIPVCRQGNLCGVMDADQFFATNKSQIGGSGRARLAEFFQQANARAYIITGHTDSRASDEYNMALSFPRASAVAKVGASTGANIVDVRGYGERMPRATNKTSRGRAENRRVEIMCIN